MKRFLSLLLCALMLLSLAACGEQAVTPPEQEEKEGQPVSDPAAAQYLATHVLAAAQYPELPPMPDEAELMAAFDALDYDKMGADAYDQAQQKIWKDWDERSETYYAALRTLRGDGVDARDTDAFLAYTQKLALTLLQSSGTEENVVFSPANLYLALAMLTECVDGESRAQLLTLLGQESVETVRACAGSLWRNLFSETAYGKTLLANALWANEDYTLKEDALGHLSGDYYGSVYSVPMGEKQTDGAIGEWVNENTGALLREAAQFETKPETLFMLLSTLYFKDQWSEQFEESGTRQGKFTAAAGGSETVDFMHLTRTMSFTRGEGFTVAELRFKGGAAMRFLLPDEGVTLSSLVESGAATGGLLSYSAGVEQTLGEVHWSVPKFDVSSDLQLIDDLKALGVSDIFNDTAADFSPLLELDEGAMVSSVQHAARVTVDENGCEAAAFTAVMADATSALPEELPVVEMNLNRPFAFLITGAEGLPLFLGTVNTLQ